MRRPDPHLLCACLIAAAHAAVCFALLAAKWRIFDPALLDAASLAWMMGDLLDVSGASGYWWRGVVWIIQPLTFAWIVPLMLIRDPLVLLAHGPLWTAAGGVLCFALARRLSGSAWLGLACELLVLLNPYASLLSLAGVVPGAEGMALVPAVLLYRQAGRLRAFSAAALLLALSRIDMLPALILWGGWMRWREHDRPFGRRALLIGGAVLGVSLICALALAAPGGRQAWGDMQLGSNAAAWTDLFSADNLRHLPLLLGLLGLPLLAPALLFPMLVSLLMTLLTTPASLADGPRRALCFEPGALVSLWSTHYRVLLPFLSAAAVVGAARLYLRLRERAPAAARALPAALIAAALAVHWTCTPPLFGPAPLTPEFNLNAYRDRPRSRLAWDLLSEVPEDQPVLMSDTFYFRAWRHGRRQLLFAGQDELSFTEWALIDLYAPATYLRRAELIERVQTMLEPRYYGVTRFEDGFLLMRRGEERDRNAAVGAWIEENRALLLRDLPVPYRRGPEPGPLYSATQRPD